MANATAYSQLPPVEHVFDGGPAGSGILDPAREVRRQTPSLERYSYFIGQTTNQALCLCLHDDERYRLGRSHMARIRCWFFFLETRHNLTTSSIERGTLGG
jgi:hypothetical protein